MSSSSWKPPWFNLPLPTSWALPTWRNAACATVAIDIHRGVLGHPESSHLYMQLIYRYMLLHSTFVSLGGCKIIRSRAARTQTELPASPWKPVMLVLVYLQSQNGLCWKGPWRSLSSIPQLFQSLPWNNCLRSKADQPVGDVAQEKHTVGDAPVCLISPTYMIILHHTL